MKPSERKRTIVSWSGGKDSCLALYRLLDEGCEVVGLLSMVSKSDGRSRAHGVPLQWLQLQAEALQIPLIMVDSAHDYALQLKSALSHLRQEHGVEKVAFGSLYSEQDREWNRQVATASGLAPLFPVWIPHNHAEALLHHWISLGFVSVICRAAETVFDSNWVGRIIDHRFVEDIKGKDICPMGEFGEYHTFVLDGPIFHQRLEIIRSETVLNSGLWSMDIQECRLADSFSNNNNG